MTGMVITVVVSLSIRYAGQKSLRMTVSKHNRMIINIIKTHFQDKSVVPCLPFSSHFSIGLEMR